MLDYREIYGADYFNRYSYTNEPYDNTPAIRQTLHDLADALCEQYMFCTHLDVGCAFGYLVEQMRFNGVRSIGCDVSQYAIDRGYQGNFVWNIAEKKLFGAYDLVTCVEVVEHIEREYEEFVLDNICMAAEQYLYFSSDLNYDEVTHINLRPRHEWIGLITQRGFKPVRFDFSYIPWGTLFQRI